VHDVHQKINVKKYRFSFSYPASFIS